LERYQKPKEFEVELDKEEEKPSSATESTEAKEEPKSEL